MPKKTSPSLPALNLSGVFERYHAIIFTVLVGGGLAAAVFLLSQLATDPGSVDGYTAPATNLSFDTQTMQRVEELRPLSEQPTPPPLPSGRTDPFQQ